MDDATPVIRNGQRLFAPSPAKPSQAEYGTAKSLSAQNKVFDFDAVFAQDATQKEVYERSVGDAVRRNIFRGYNTTIIAYGQTGSGKTYTMGGKREAELANLNDLSPTSRSRIPRLEDSRKCQIAVVPRVSTRSLKMIQLPLLWMKTTESFLELCTIFSKRNSVMNLLGEVVIQLTYLEIYNDELRDLLVDDNGEEPTYMKLVRPR